MEFDGVSREIDACCESIEEGETSRMKSGFCLLRCRSSHTASNSVEDGLLSYSFS